MRVSRERAEKNRQAVIDAASRLFRQHGFDGIGLKDLMKGAGLTQGGFYKQFESKEDLVVQASRRATEMAIRRWSAVTAASPDAPLEALIALYLSTEHREKKDDGCPLVALGADAARQGPEVKASFEAGVRAHLQILDGIVSADQVDKPYARAMAMLSTMVGALTLSRMVNDENLSQGFLDVAIGQVRAIAAIEGDA